MFLVSLSFSLSIFACFLPFILRVQCATCKTVEIENYKDLVTQPTNFFFFFQTMQGKQNEDYFYVRHKSSKSLTDFDENILVDKKTSLISYV